MKTFALIGVAGYIAPRHMAAIKELGHELIAAYDPYDGVGILDSYFPNCQFFTEIERFDRFLDKWKRKENNNLDYISICSPNYLHDSHIRFALKHDAHAICEKPLVLNPWNLDQLRVAENETSKKVFTILQLRYHESIKHFKKLVFEKLESDPEYVFEIDLDYITSRGSWYHQSWKGDIRKSGGISTNIGIHFFDMLCWVFGSHREIILNKRTELTEAGVIKFKNALVRWKLSIDKTELPHKDLITFRSLRYDGLELEFSKGFTDLHLLSYSEIIKGNGFGLNDAVSSINIVSQLRNMPLK